MLILTSDSSPEKSGLSVVVCTVARQRLDSMTFIVDLKNRCEGDGL